MCSRFLNVIVLVVPVLTSFVFPENGEDRCPQEKCISIENCMPIKLALQNNSVEKDEVYNRINNLSCRFVKGIPLVCCPEPEQNPNDYNIVPLERTRRNFSKIRTRSFKPLRRPDCGGTNSSRPTKITGGIPARRGDFPWLVALGYKSGYDNSSASPTWLCGGSLISKRHILTAAHCVRTNNKYELYTARLGDLNLYEENDKVTVSDIMIEYAKVHEDYNPRLTFSDDIAILRLAEEVNNPTVWPICLPIDEPLKSFQFADFFTEVAGWGSQQFRGSASSVLLKTTLKVTTTEECREALSEFNKVVIDDRTICAEFDQGGRSACGGDSGGPLMFSEDGILHRKIFSIIGVVSHGYQCGQPKYPGVYMRVTHYLDWILKNMD